MAVRNEHRSGLAVVIAALAMAAVVTMGFHFKGTGQSSRNTTPAEAKSANGTGVSETRIERLSAPDRASSEFRPERVPAALLASAASRNVTLQDQLAWVFGGRQQHGWRLYAPLVGGMIGTEGGPESGDFAARLMDWQRQRGVDATGILDNSTWSEMIDGWQAARLSDHSMPAPDQLVTIPISDCYDPTREEELRKAERATYAAYKRMVAAAAADPSLGLAVNRDGELATGELYFKIVSAFRSREYQAKLRAQSPKSGRAGLALNSPHFTGRALDLYVGGDPVSTKDDNRLLQTQTKAYRWLAKNASRFGFRPYFYEPWHWEYVGK